MEGSLTVINLSDSLANTSFIVKFFSVYLFHIFRFYSIDLKSLSDYLMLEFPLLFEVLNFL